MPILLICKKRHIKFYQKFNFQLMNNDNIIFKDRAFNCYCMIYSNKFGKIRNSAIKIYTNK